jgi:helix-turn-helix protein
MPIDTARADFEAWERQTRGHKLWSYPVDLEPATRSLDALVTEQRSPRRRALFASDPLTPAALSALGVAASRATSAQECPVELQMLLPPRFVGRPGSALRLLQQLHLSSHPVSFELVGLPRRQVVQLCCARDDEDFIRGAMASHFPEIRINRSEGFLGQHSPLGEYFTSTIDFGLLEGFHLPLSRRVAVRSDPFAGVSGAISRVRSRETAVFQAIFHRVTKSWGADLWEILSRAEWARELLPLARGKMSDPLVAVVFRVSVRSFSAERAEERVKEIGAALVAASRSEHNYLIPLTNEGYSQADHVADVLGRQTRRNGMILTLSELHTFVHPISEPADGRAEFRIADARTKPRARIGSHDQRVSVESAGQRHVAADSSGKEHFAEKARGTRLTAKDAAAFLGLAPQTLAKMRVVGSSPPYYKVGRLVMYDRSELDAWLAVRRRRSTSDSTR